ncbi:MAG: penicillin-binding protein 2 [Parcubacteria group bacterium]|nr:penicillin-binding protein 2 [Parcubacteria group bacterium]
MGVRFIIAISFFGVLYAALILGLYNLQLEKGDYYSARAASQNQSADILESKRGKIYFTGRNGNLIPAAINKEFSSIFAVPDEIADKKGAAEILSPIAGIEADRLLKMFDKKGDLYELLVKKAAPEQITAVKKSGVGGIYIDGRMMRHYPMAGSASQLLGFVGASADDEKMAGRYGVELFYDERLSGKQGDTVGDKIKNIDYGEDVVLTVDRNLQNESEKILAGLTEKFEAEGGTVIIEDPKTGKILAMAGNPAFDLNNYDKSNVKLFLNPAAQKIYEPGSVFKVVTMASGLDAGKITPDTAYYDNGELTINGRTIKNWDLKAHGKLTMTGVIEGSVNTGAVFAERRLGHDLFYDYLKKFGFEEKTGVDLPGELNGSLKNLKESARDINFATASFGQGVSVTPLQLINAVAVIANGGVLMRPYVNASLEPMVIRRVVGEEAARQTAAMMESAVEKAKIAAIPNYRVAGKTGTAQIPDFTKGGYSDSFIHTFVGFAPVSSPRFIILIKLDKPRATLAGMTVVPAFKELAQFVLNYYGVPPDNLIVD